MNNLDSLITFLGWAALTYSWLNINFTFASAIRQAIEDHNGELEGGGRRSTDPIWSLKVFKIQKVVTKPETPVVYYLFDGPKRGFVREELMVVPLGMVLPPVDYLR